LVVKTQLIPSRGQNGWCIFTQISLFPFCNIIFV